MRRRETIAWTSPADSVQPVSTESVSVERGQSPSVRKLFERILEGEGQLDKDSRLKGDVRFCNERLT